MRSSSELLGLFKTAFILALGAIALQMLFVSMVPEAPPIDWEILKGTPLDNRDKAVVQLSARQPLAYLLRGFLNSSEVLQLVKTAQQQYGAGGFIWKAQSGKYVHNLRQAQLDPLYGSPGVTALLARIDQRLHAAVREHIPAPLAKKMIGESDSGYLALSPPGRPLENLHNDNHKADLQPRRLASLVVYLSTSPPTTSFPLAASALSSHEEEVGQGGRGEGMRQGREAMRALGDEGCKINGEEAWRRVDISEAKRFRHRARCIETASAVEWVIERARRLCDRASSGLDRATPESSPGQGEPWPRRVEQGDALLFFAIDGGGKEDRHAMHGACNPIPNQPGTAEASHKLVLAKFVREAISEAAAYTK